MVGDDIAEDWASDLLDCRSLRHFADFFECRSVIFVDAREAQIRDVDNLAMFWDDLHLPHLENAQKIAEAIIATLSQLPAWTAVLMLGAVVYAVGRIGRSVVDAFRQNPLSR